MHPSAFTRSSTASTRNIAQSSTGNTVDQAQALLREAAVDLRDGIDPGDPLTQKGRIKKRSRDRDSFDPEDPDRYRYKAYHIRRAFDLFGHIPTIINDGIKRRAKEISGEDTRNIQTDRDHETFNLILNHLEGLNDDIMRLQRDPKAFRALVRKIRDAADQARNNDTANLKKDICCMLTADGSSVLTIIIKGKKASSKHDRGFENEVMGKYLCPITLDWDDLAVREEIREGKLSILAQDWPRLLYANCECNLDDLEAGLGRNMALVRVVKYLFTGRSAAFSESAGGKTTRSGNAALAGMKEVTPRVVAYAACMLRYAISNEESWTMVDKEFNLQEFYWHVVDIFDDSGTFGKELLAWWNMKVFGTSTDTTLQREPQPTPASLSILRRQREAKRASGRVLSDITNTSEDRRARDLSPESEEDNLAPFAQLSQPRLQPVQFHEDRETSVSVLQDQAIKGHSEESQESRLDTTFGPGISNMLRRQPLLRTYGRGEHLLGQSPVHHLDSQGHTARAIPSTGSQRIESGQNGSREASPHDSVVPTSFELQAGEARRTHPPRAGTSSAIYSNTNTEMVTSRRSEYHPPSIARFGSGSPVQTYNQRGPPPPPWQYTQAIGTAANSSRGI